MINIMPHQKRKIGDVGELITCNSLKAQGYTLIARNYLRKWGEIDIIAKKEDVLFFIEVKTIRSKMLSRGNFVYRPEENMSYAKRKKLRRTIETYLSENNLWQIEWKFVLASVRLKESSENALSACNIELLEEVI